MPPLCAPLPPYAMANQPPPAPAMAMAMAMPGPGAEAEDADRARLVAALVAALTGAVAAEEERSGEHPAQHQRLLAARAYDSLCFDFPMVSTDALAAVAAAFRSTSLSNAPSVFPVTERFVSGLRYLVSKEFKEPGPSDGRLAGEDVRTERGGETSGDPEVRRNYLMELCGCVFLLAPAVRLGVACKDDGVSLRDFLAEYVPAPVDSLGREDANDDFEKNPCNGRQSLEVESKNDDEMPGEMDDDGSDWEALETFTSPSEDIVSDKLAIPSDTGKAAWSHLTGKVVALSGLVPLEVIKSGVWDQLQLTDHLIQVLKSLKLLDRKHPEVDWISVAKLYTKFVADHVLANWSNSSSEVSRLVSALMGLVESTEEIKNRNALSAKGTAPKKAWNELVLSTLAGICSNAGSCPPCNTSSSKACADISEESSPRNRRRRSLPSASFVRSLWQSVFSNMQFLRSQLIESVGGSGSFGRVEMVLWILCFVVKSSPGNFDLRSTILEGGMFRSALQLFAKVGHEENMESLRHFLLLSMAASPPLANFAAQVPFFIAAIPATRDLVEGSCMGAHALVWPLILRAACDQSRTEHSNQFKSNDAERVMVDAFEIIVESVADGRSKTDPYSFQRNLLWVHRLLVLLEEATSAYCSSTFKLWRPRSPLDISISRCQAAVGSALGNASWTAFDSDSQKAPSREQRPQDSEDISGPSEVGVADCVACPLDESKEKSGRHPTSTETEMMAVQEKVHELLTSMLRKLKRLSALTRENREAKID